MAKKDLDLSFLNQNYEEIELPSLGKLYKNKEVKNGKIHIRPWVTTEEKLIDKFNKGNFYSVVKRLVQNTIEEKFNVEELTKGDFFYLLYWVRLLSYGSTYNMDTQCPKCSSDIKVKIDLKDFPVTYLPDIIEPISFTMPQTKIELKMRLPRVKDIIDATEKTHSDYMRIGININEELYLFAKCVEEMILPNEERTVLTDKDDFDTMLHRIWSKLPASDILAFREELKKYNHGYVENSFVKCPECEKFFEQAPVLSFEFFRPSE